MNHTPNQYTSCIEACQVCATACHQCFAACLKEDDVKMMARCIALDADCAAICGLAADAMARNSEHAAAICALCAQICKALDPVGSGSDMATAKSGGHRFRKTADPDYPVQTIEGR